MAIGSKKDLALDLLQRRNKYNLPNDVFVNEAIAVTGERALHWEVQSDFENQREAIKYQEGVNNRATLALKLLLTIINSSKGRSPQKQDDVPVKKDEEKKGDESKTESHENQTPQETGKTTESFELAKKSEDSLERGGVPEKDGEDKVKTPSTKIIPDYYNVLGVSSDASSAEIKAARNKLILQESSDSVEADLRSQGLSTEDVMNHPRYLAAVRRMQDINEAYTVLQGKNRADYDTVKKEQDNESATSGDSDSPTNINNYAIVLTPTQPATKESQDAFNQTKDFRDAAQNTSHLDVSIQDIEALKAQNVFPAETTTNEILMGIDLYSRGVQSTQTMSLAESRPGQSGPAVDTLMRIALVEAELEEAKITPPSKTLALANNYPNISITTTKVPLYSPNRINFTSDNGGGINQILRSAGGKAQDFIGKTFQKTLAPAFKKGKEALAKKGAEILLKAGVQKSLQAAAQSLNAIIPGLGIAVGALIQLLGKGIEKILVSLKKLFKDNKEVAAGLGLITLGVGAVVGSVPLMVLGGGILGAMVLTAGVGVAAAGTGAAITATFVFVVVTVVTTIPRFLGTIILVFVFVAVFTIYIINSGAYVTPISIEQGLPGVTPLDCIGAPPPKPAAEGLRSSIDGKYTFPVSHFAVPGYSCYHWDHNKAADIFSTTPRPPLVAYESGKIVYTNMNDPLGGKNFILKGDSGRYYYYAHNCHLYVHTGQSVASGEVVSIMDETGNGRVEHLHFAINQSPLSDYFSSGAGNVCPQKDFEDKFKFNVCTQFCY